METLVLDGAVGTELESRGFVLDPIFWTALAAKQAPELLATIHLDYLSAGARLITANTFRTSPYLFRKHGVDGMIAREMTYLSVDICRQVCDLFWKENQERAWVAGSVAPLEDCYRPELAPGERILAREHAEHIKSLVGTGCDVVLAETMGTVREALAVTTAAQAAGAAQIFISFIVDASGKRLLGGDDLVQAAESVLDAGAHAVLVNCVEPALAASALATLQPLRAKHRFRLGAYTNASKMSLDAKGTPTWQPLGPSGSIVNFAGEWIERFGVSILGGCCGTTPKDIEALVELL